jgi:hypothetical protein
MPHGTYVRPRPCHVTHRLGYDMPHGTYARCKPCHVASRQGIGHATYAKLRPCHVPHRLDVVTLALGLQPRQGFTRVQAKRGAREWENVRMNTHTPKWIPMLGVGVPVDSQNIRERLQRSKPLALRSSLYHWTVIEA